MFYNFENIQIFTQNQYVTSSTKMIKTLNRECGFVEMQNKDELQNGNMREFFRNIRMLGS
jgi:hypothetical protein